MRSCFFVFLVTAWLLDGCTPADPDTDWSVYLGDAGRTHYSTLEQINRRNVASLELAWIYDSGDLRRGTSTMYTSPLVVNGVLFDLSPTLVAFALNAATGEELWRYDQSVSDETQRGLMWWRSGDQSRLFYTAGSTLIALDPQTGLGIEEIGDQGRLDLSAYGAATNATAINVAVPGVIFDDLIILGLDAVESQAPQRASIVAISANDGDLVWQFDTIAQAGEPGAETWADGALANAGGANAAAGMTLDIARELLFIPTGSATPEFLGAQRQGANLYANTLLALNARTGNLRWHQQILDTTSGAGTCLHHLLWYNSNVTAKSSMPLPWQRNLATCISSNATLVSPSTTRMT